MNAVGPLLLAAVLGVAVPGSARADEVLVFAAASLRDALQEVAGAWHETTGHTAVLSLAGSSTLARQIEAGAPADLFLSANEAWVDELEHAGLIEPGSRRDLLKNSLVIVAHDPEATPLDMNEPDGLKARLGDSRLAMALVDAVPAGIYGKAALQSLGWWDDLAPSVAQTDNVRTALALVATGEAPFGIVYATDALAEPRVTVVGRFPAETHPPIVYPLVRIAGGTSEAAEGLAEFLAGPEAATVFRALGFALASEGG
jgi:molybdate transport system substrate-binding protein